MERPIVAAPAYLGGGVTELDTPHPEEDDDTGAAAAAARRAAARRSRPFADVAGGDAAAGAEDAPAADDDGEGGAVPLGEAEVEGIETLLLGRSSSYRRHTQQHPPPSQPPHGQSSPSDSTPCTPLGSRWRVRSPQPVSTGSFPGEERGRADGAAAAAAASSASTGKSEPATGRAAGSCTPPATASAQPRVRPPSASYQRPPRPHHDAFSPDVSLTAPTAASAAASTQTALHGVDVSPARMLRPLRFVAVDGHDAGTPAAGASATTAGAGATLVGNSGSRGATAAMMESGSAATSTLTLTTGHHPTAASATMAGTLAVLPSYGTLASQDDMASSAFTSGVTPTRGGLHGAGPGNVSSSHTHRDSSSLYDMGQQSLEEQHHHYRMAACGALQTSPQQQQQQQLLQCARGASASPAAAAALDAASGVSAVAAAVAAAAAAAGAELTTSSPATAAVVGGDGGRSPSPAVATATSAPTTAAAAAVDGPSATNGAGAPVRVVPVLLTPTAASAPAHSRRAAEEQSFLDEVQHEPVDFAALHHSSYTTVCDTVSIVVCMVGLPGRGKSFISKRLVRYMNWKGVPCKVFNAGNYRRQLLGVEGTAGADFFDPNNPQGAQLRERMAELACEDLVGFIAAHPLAVGILDATNTTRKRRAWLRDYFQQEADKRGLPYRLLFIESVCTDDTIVTENILRSKCDNDDFKNVKDVNAVIAEFRSRILQYEKVYETLEPDECMAYIKIINVKHHVMLHRVPNGLGSRIAFFLLNLHPIAFPIYVALPGETVGDSRHVYGGEERLTARGEAYAVALKNFIQDRYVPHMVVLHATNYSVLSTLAPLMGGATEEEGALMLQMQGSPVIVGHTAATRAKASPTSAFAHETAVTGAAARPTRHTASPAGESPTRAVDALAAPTADATTGSDAAAASTSHDAVHASHRHSSTSNVDGALCKLHPYSPNTSIDELRAMAGGDLSQVPLPSMLVASASASPSGPVAVGGADASATAAPGAASPSHTSPQTVPTEERTVQASAGGVDAGHVGGRASTEADDVDADAEDGDEDEEYEEEEEELGDEVLCPVPGLDNINFGRFSGHTAAWVKEKYPRLSALLYDVGGDSNTGGSPSGPLPPPSQQQQQHGGSARGPASSSGLSVDVRDGTGMAGGACRTAPLPPPVHYATHEEAAAHLQHAPSGADPRLSYCIQFPNGESCRQVNVRLEPALMAVMRTQSPVFVVAPAVPAQGILSFFMDVIPELSPTIRIPSGCVVEIGVKNTITVHPLLPDSLPESMTRSPLTVLPELQEAIREAAAAAAAGAMEKSSSHARTPAASSAAEAVRSASAEPAATSAAAPMPAGM